jgi:hypothetical protein
MKLDIHERDIEPKLCQRCAACCRITFNLQDTTPRYRRFLRQIGYNLLPPPAQGQADCCDKKHDVKVDMGYCRHLEIEERPEGKFYRCRIYGTNDFPDLCAQFNCVSWAKANDTYSERNTLLVRAQQALNRLQKRVEG